jgi:hypothetical protein
LDEDSYNINSSDDPLDSYDSSHSFEKTFDKFPNEAYADLMALVLKNNLSISTGNEIISFFNKYSNLSISPLPKNIQQGYKFMNNIKQPNLEYFKTCVLSHNNIEYFLFHWPLISCIKNILEIPNIFQDFAMDFKVLYQDNPVIKLFILNI